MRIERQPQLVWFGVLGAPLAWTAQLWSGIALTFADCGAGTRGWDLPVGTLRVALMALPTAVALLAAASAYAVLRATRGASGEPPAGRVRFLATIGVTVSVLFSCLIVMGGLGMAIVDPCHQG